MVTPPALADIKAFTSGMYPHAGDLREVGHPFSHLPHSFDHDLRQFPKADGAVVSDLLHTNDTTSESDHNHES